MEIDFIQKQGACWPLQTGPFCLMPVYAFHCTEKVFLPIDFRNGAQLMAKNVLSAGDLRNEYCANNSFPVPVKPLHNRNCFNAL